MRSRIIGLGFSALALGALCCPAAAEKSKMGCEIGQEVWNASTGKCEPGTPKWSKSSAKKSATAKPAEKK